MQDMLVGFGALTCVICVCLFFISILLYIVALYKKNTQTKEKLAHFALKLFVFSLIGAVVGFGVCGMNFELNIH